MVSNPLPIFAEFGEQTLFADLFELSFEETGNMGRESYTGEVAQVRSILAVPGVTEEAGGWLVKAEILSTSRSDNEMRYSVADGIGTVSTNAWGDVMAVPGEHGMRLRAELGTAAEECELAAVPAVARTNWLYAADAPGSLRAEFNGAVSNGIDAEGTTILYEWTDPEAKTVRSNFFARAWDFSCVSSWSDYGDGYTQFATLITPQHAACANHWKRGAGAEVAFDSERRRVLAAAQTGVEDMTVLLLDRPVTNALPALLAGVGAGDCTLLPEEPVSGVPGIQAIALNQGWRAHVLRITSALDEANLHLYDGDTNALPESIALGHIRGGDSGSPVFLVTAGTNRPILTAVLYRASNYGPKVPPWTNGILSHAYGPNWSAPGSRAGILAAIARTEELAGIETEFSPEFFDVSDWPNYNPLNP